MAQLQRLTIARDQCSQDNIITLTAEQQHYLSRVLRLKAGDRFIALLEQGGRQLAELLPHQSAQLIEPLDSPNELAPRLRPPITLCAALMKGQGFEDVVRTATELGVTQIVPILSQFTVVNPSDHKLERWRRIAAEAAEQSCRQTIPQVFAPVSLEAALVQSFSNLPVQVLASQRFICVTEGAAANFLQTLIKLPKHSLKLGMLIMVGPEGGWSSTEQSLAINQGFVPISLGHNILRAVTASIAVVSVLSIYTAGIDTVEE